MCWLGSPLLKRSSKKLTLVNYFSNFQAINTDNELKFYLKFQHFHFLHEPKQANIKFVHTGFTKGLFFWECIFSCRHLRDSNSFSLLIHLNDSFALRPSLHLPLHNTYTPEEAYIRCRGGTARGWCASHLCLLFLLRLLRSSVPQIARTHCDADFPLDRPPCSPSISTASSAQLTVSSWGCAPKAGWPSECCGSSQCEVMTAWQRGGGFSLGWSKQGDSPDEEAVDDDSVSHLCFLELSLGIVPRVFLHTNESGFSFPANNSPLWKTLRLCQWPPIALFSLVRILSKDSGHCCTLLHATLNQPLTIITSKTWPFSTVIILLLKLWLNNIFLFLLLSFLFSPLVQHICYPRRAFCSVSSSSCGSSRDQLCESVAASSRRDCRWLGLLRPLSFLAGALMGTLQQQKNRRKCLPPPTPPHTYTRMCTCTRTHAYLTSPEPGQLCVSTTDKASWLPESTLWGLERCSNSQTFANIHSSVTKGGVRR